MNPDYQSLWSIQPVCLYHHYQDSSLPERSYSPSCQLQVNLELKLFFGWSQKASNLKSNHSVKSYLALKTIVRRKTFHYQRRDESWAAIHQLHHQHLRRAIKREGAKQQVSRSDIDESRLPITTINPAGLPLNHNYQNSSLPERSYSPSCQLQVNLELKLFFSWSQKPSNLKSKHLVKSYLALKTIVRRKNLSLSAPRWIMSCHPSTPPLAPLATPPPLLSQGSGNIKTPTLILTSLKGKCNKCDYASSQAGHLRTHFITHNGVKLIKCNLCDHAFSQAGYLKRHFKHSWRMQTVLVCNSQPSNLWHHLKTHTGEKSNKCNHCD